jgi:hypothetical protein
VITVTLAIIFAFFIPNTPHHIRWLTEQEKAQLQYRLEVDRASKDATDEVSVGRAFIMAVTDVKTWLLCSILQCNYIAASVTNFFPIVSQLTSATVAWSRLLTDRVGRCRSRLNQDQ